MPGRNTNLHLVSDSTGETLNSMARAVLARFDAPGVIQHRWFLVRSRLNLDRVIEGIEHEPGPVVFTLVDSSLRHSLEEACHRLGVPSLSPLDAMTDMLQAEIGARAKERRAAQHVMDADYFRRIDAMHYVLSHDDGQGTAGIRHADLVLVGVSRSSKTPTCFYLANRGIKAANIPLVPGASLPPELENPPCPVIGLTIDAGSLIDIRRNRLKIIGAGGVRQGENEYVDPDAVKAEILAARRLCSSRGWPVIDVTRRSIEETAALILQQVDLWHARRNGTVTPKPEDPAAAIIGAPAEGARVVTHSTIPSNPARRGG
ncbi:pyruvate, water dikinase regulatory protein [Sabulicella glaciei]|uniref:Putative pyruvate, phosphate dikinase regulatory protein n=1 Tax=Sabulicella glaciei TaxID=2984948 RepID=A0ABT3P127_9PROT|nr:pyruvate, water dikinase regulatory protein [Roseococcus sp. MDT2-1-1]MCW8088112.1 kinase/pyrophosphorylase [Roseococcus sp. MDT2-1-1]